MTSNLNISVSQITLIDKLIQDNGAYYKFFNWIGQQENLDFSNYSKAWNWSISNIEAFWKYFFKFINIKYSGNPTKVLIESEKMQDTKWFPDVLVNYAENIFNYDKSKSTDVAIIGIREDGFREELTWEQLEKQVASLRKVFVDKGIKIGDRVVAYAPNCIDTVVAFLATVSLGAVWSACNPEFNSAAVIKRFESLSPKVLITATKYLNSGIWIDLTANIRNISHEISSIEMILLTDINPESNFEFKVKNIEKVRDLSTKYPTAKSVFERVPFQHPLWVLHSSGTTGPPKGIVQSHGGIILEHIKVFLLHLNLGVNDRFCWFTTIGWMVWNMLISSLLVGTSIVLYEGSPLYSDIQKVWEITAAEKITFLGLAPQLLSMYSAVDFDPKKFFNLEKLKIIGSSGAILPVPAAIWIHESVGKNVLPASVSGGTDVCSAFLLPAPEMPIRAGELGARALGAAIKAFDDEGNEIIDQIGELVITKPMPSMPVKFWNDPDGILQHNAYFDYYKNVWRHGDWVQINSDGSVILAGRSDATLNRGGIRIGTAELYAVIEEIPGIKDCLVVEYVSALEKLNLGEVGKILCFIEIEPGFDFDNLVKQVKHNIYNHCSSKHMPDKVIQVPAVPRTHTNKRTEIPIKKILAGIEVTKAIDASTLINPSAIDFFVEYAKTLEN